LYGFTGIALASSLLVLLSMLKLFMSAFWGEPKAVRPERSPPSRGLYLPVALLLALIVLIGVGAEWVNGYVTQASAVLLQPELYIDAVLKE
jgi:multicomponent Na+:H+ antiporter subunit D